jgi:hypothetical protein
MKTKKPTKTKPLSQSASLCRFLENVFKNFYPDMVEVRDVADLRTFVERWEYKPASAKPSGRDLVIKGNRLLQRLRQKAIEAAGTQNYVVLVYDFLKSGAPIAKFAIDVPSKGALDVADISEWVPAKQLTTDRPVPPESEPEASFTSLSAIGSLPERISTNVLGLDYVLGGGIVPGSLTLLTGDQGIGKSTLLLQACCGLAKKTRVLYATGEEQVNAIAHRANRLGLEIPTNLFVARENDLEDIIDAARKTRILVIDSAQSLHVYSEKSGDMLKCVNSAALKTALQILNDIAAETGITVIITGHMTKDGGIANPRTLEYAVDTSIHLSAPKADSPLRKLSCPHKNRHGEVPREAAFKMTEKGLQEIK